jgi:hypothetical protein
MLDFIEKWPEQLALFIGQGGRPLAYVVRDVIIPEAAYGSMRDENQARSAHGTHAYCEKSAAVFEMIKAVITKHKNVKTWIKSFAI